MIFFLTFYLKKNKILRVHVKDKSSKSSGLQACNFIKNRLQSECFSVNIPSFSNSLFYGTTPVAPFELCFSIRNF